jgi:hypothetical protein
VSGEFLYPTMHCPKTPDVWQVGIDFTDSSDSIGTPQRIYFLVRWQPPFVFRLIEVSTHPSEACKEEDRTKPVRCSPSEIGAKPPAKRTRDSGSGR